MTKHLSLRLALCLALVPSVMGGALPAMAADKPEPNFTITLSQTDRADIKRVEDYLGRQVNLTAAFEQQIVQPSGQTAVQTGKLALKLPGKMRIDYDAPSTDFIVADGDTLYAWDGQMRQQSQVGLSDTLAGLLLKPNLKLDDEAVTPVAVARPKPDLLDVGLRSAKDPESGTLTLHLSDVPLRLTGWTVLDAQGNVTNVRLSDVKTDAALPDKLFRFKNPDFGNQRK